MSKASISKNEIYQTSIKLFAQRGVSKVTMRELAEECGLSLGAFYYHYKNKDELILAFYQELLEVHIQKVNGYLLTAPKNLSVVMNWICESRFDELSPYKEMLRPYMSKIDLDSKTSFFSIENKSIRRDSVALFTRVANHCLSSSNEVSTIIGRFLWLHHLVVLGYWLRGNNQVKMIQESVKLWKWLPLFLKLPGSKKLLKNIKLSLSRLALWEEYHEK